MKCSQCRQVLEPDDSLAFDGDSIFHVDCRRPHHLSHEERALLFTYCFDHAVTCPRCLQDFRQIELASDIFGGRTHLCPRCRVELTPKLREHLYNCALLPRELRYRAREARAATQLLIKESHQASDRSDVLLRETEARLAAHRSLMQQATGALAALREVMGKPR